MKKQLYGTTALVAAGLLVAVPGAQAAEEPLKIGVSGYMEQWFGWADNDDPVGNTPAGGLGNFNETGQHSDNEVQFKATTTLDNGLTVGVVIELEGEFSPGDQIDEQYLILQGGFGRILFGDENSAQYLMQYKSPNVGIGIMSGDSSKWIREQGQDSGTLGGGASFGVRTPYSTTGIEVDAQCNDCNRLTYFTPRIQGFQFGVSYAADSGQDKGDGINDEAGNLTNIFNVGANFKRTFNDVDVGLAFGWGTADNRQVATDGEDPEVISFGGFVGFAGFKVGGGYATQLGALQTPRSTGGVVNLLAANEDATGWEVGGSYTTGPWAVSVNYFESEREGLLADPDEDRQKTINGSASYSLGPGIKFIATLGYSDFDAEDTAENAGIEQDNNGAYLVGGFKVSF